MKDEKHNANLSRSQFVCSNMNSGMRNLIVDYFIDEGSSIIVNSTDSIYKDEKPMNLHGASVFKIYVLKNKVLQNKA